MAARVRTFLEPEGNLMCVGLTIAGPTRRWTGRSHAWNMSTFLSKPCPASPAAITARPMPPHWQRWAVPYRWGACGAFVIEREIGGQRGGGLDGLPIRY